MEDSARSVVLVAGEWSLPLPVLVNENVLDWPVLALTVTLKVLPEGASGNLTFISHLP